MIGPEFSFVNITVRHTDNFPTKYRVKLNAAKYRVLLTLLQVTKQLQSQFPAKYRVSWDNHLMHTRFLIDKHVTVPGWALYLVYLRH